MKITWAFTLEEANYVLAALGASPLAFAAGDTFNIAFSYHR